MFYVYITKSEEGRFYIGSTEDIPKRLDNTIGKRLGDGLLGITTGGDSFIVKNFRVGLML